MALGQEHGISPVEVLPNLFLPGRNLVGVLLLASAGFVLALAVFRARLTLVRAVTTARERGNLARHFAQPVASILAALRAVRPCGKGSSNRPPCCLPTSGASPRWQRLLPQPIWRSAPAPSSLFVKLRAPPFPLPMLVWGSCGLMRLPLNAEPSPARSKPTATTSPRPHFG